MGRRLSRVQEPAVVGAATLVLAVALVPPLVQIVGAAITGGAAPMLAFDPRLLWLLARSIALALMVTACALVVGVPLGVLFARAAIPWRRALLAAHLIIVALPPIIPALGWFRLFGQQGIIGGESSARLLFSELGVVLVLVACFTPIVTVLTAIAVAGVERTIEDAARIVAGPRRTAARVLVPCAAPGIALSGVLVFTLAFADLGVPTLLRVDVYPTAVLARLGGMSFAPAEAAVLAMPAVLVALAIVALERRVAGRRAIAVLAGTRSHTGPLFAASRTSTLIGVAAASISLAPLAVLVLDALRPGALADALPRIGHTIWNSLRAAILAAAVATAIAIPIGAALAHRRAFAIWLDGLAIVGFVMPSSLLAIGMVGAWNRPGTQWLYASFAVLVVGHVARTTAIATRSFAAATAQMPVALEHAAQTLGAGYLLRLRTIIVLARRGVLVTFALVLVLALRDLDAAAVYYPPGGEPLLVRIFTLEANAPAATVSVLACVHVLITALAVALVAVLARPKERG